MKFKSTVLYALKDIKNTDAKQWKELFFSIPKGTFNHSKYVNSLHKRMGFWMDFIDYLYQLPYLKVVTVPFFMLLLLALLAVFDVLCLILKVFKIM